MTTTRPAALSIFIFLSGGNCFEELNLNTVLLPATFDLDYKAADRGRPPGDRRPVTPYLDESAA